MGTILVEKGSIWRRIFLLEPVTASEAQKAGLARILQSRYHKLTVGELYSLTVGPLASRPKRLLLIPEWS